MVVIHTRYGGYDDYECDINGKYGIRWWIHGSHGEILWWCLIV